MLASSMNNRFKFRVWDKLAKRMIYPHNDNQQHFIIDLNGRFHNLQNGSGGDDYVIQQYTGLTDSNDDPIYEGDILKNHYDVGNNIIGQVLYEADHGGYIFQWKRKGRNQDYNNLNCDLAFESVIVGNIFEHSELLK
jgi:uncharacterized phage protein (TIGR01671 family)